MSFYNTYRSTKYSQHGEDGLLAEIIRRINPEKVACEFGAADGKRYSNTYALLEAGWQCYFIESNEEYRFKLFENILGYRGNAIMMSVSKNNINAIVPLKLGLLSIDVDNDDYHLWKAYKGESDIVVIEINSGIMPPKEEIPGTSGASYVSMLKLAIEKGYFLIAHTGNMVFCLNKYRHLFPELKGDGIKNWEDYFDKELV